MSRKLYDNAAVLFETLKAFIENPKAVDELTKTFASNDKIIDEMDKLDETRIEVSSLISKQTSQEKDLEKREASLVVERSIFEEDKEEFADEVDTVRQELARREEVAEVKIKEYTTKITALDKATSVASNATKEAEIARDKAQKAEEAANKVKSEFEAKVAELKKTIG